MLRRNSRLMLAVFMISALLLNASIALASEAALLLTVVEVTNKGDVSLTFDKEMAEPVEGAEGQFAVLAEGMEIKVKMVEKTNTPEKIKLVLEQKVKASQEVTVAYTQGENEELWVKAADGTVVESFEPQLAGDKTRNTEGPVEKPSVKVNDIKDHWAKDIIQQLANADVLILDEESNFKPDQAVTRAEFAAMLVKGYQWKNVELKEFPDTADHWANEYIAVAAGRGIVEGYKDGNFGPEELITREQIAAMISRAAKLEGPVEGKEFADADKIADWAQESVQLASGFSILTGLPDGTFQPKANATKAEAAAIVYRALQLRNK
ncbi:MAG: S-layer homology domain-containing protein [bacterium]|jgi:uncharacterized repeat protein (TIGR02059 family)